MPSSGQGNSFQSDFTACQRLFYNRHRLGLVKAGRTEQAAPLVIGTALHAYADALIKARLAGREYAEAERLGWAAFDHELGDPDPEYVPLLEREALARVVLPVWSVRLWDRFERQVIRPISSEQHLEMELPADTDYGPIRPELRTYTGRIDFVYEQLAEEPQGPPPGAIVVADWKGTKAMSPKDMVREYLMDSAHLGYAALWNFYEGEEYRCDGVVYYMIRLHPKVNSPAAFHEEWRPLNNAQLTDWYARLLAERAAMSALWDRAENAWLRNDGPNGPCLKYGHQCEFWDLCARPSDARLLRETAYERGTR